MNTRSTNIPREENYDLVFKILFCKFAKIVKNILKYEKYTCNR